MPPKKKGKGKKGKKGNKKNQEEDSGPTKWDNISEKDLNEHLKKTKEELEQCQVSRNYYQLERDVYQKYYNILKKNVTNIELRIKEKDQEMQKSEKSHRGNILQHVRRVRQLEYQQGNEISKNKSTKVTMVRDAESKHTENENKLKTRKLDLKLTIQQDKLR